MNETIHIDTIKNNNTSLEEVLNVIHTSYKNLMEQIPTPKRYVSDNIETILNKYYTLESLTDKNIFSVYVLGELAAVFCITHKSSIMCELSLFYIMPKFQRQRLGHFILNWIERIYLPERITELHVRVRVDNKSGINFWNKLGFKNSTGGIFYNWCAGVEWRSYNLIKTYKNIV